MITLKLSAYSKEEIENLISVLDECAVMVESAFCRDRNNCSECVNKHLCDDIIKALDFAHKSLNEKKTR